MSTNAATTSTREERGSARSFEGVRLDPRALPHRFRYDTGVDPRTGKPMGDAAVILDASMAQVCRRLPSGIPMAMRLPMAAFEGVSVRVVPAVPGPEGDVEAEGVVVVELLHRDPQLSLPLVVARDLDDVTADWKAWARALMLPMLLVEPDGSWRAIETRIGSVVVAPVKPRRRRSVLKGRRPRFLVRRKVGVPAPSPIVVEKREIFGRE
ncbi:MAG: DUF6101 family protein [Siculibacillus sp.]